MIDQIKIGGFLKELRKEKSLTQEQLAEKLGVSSRSVSRWENGSTLPELGILVELADYYEVDIREIIDGERKNEVTEKENNETLRKVAGYAQAEKQSAVMRKCIVTCVGTLFFALCFVLGGLALPELPEGSIFRSNGLWLATGLLGVAGLWAIVIRERLKNSAKDKR